MGLEEVKQEVLAKAKERAYVILNEGKTEVSRMMSKAREDVREQERIINEEIQRKLSLMERRAASSAEIEVKKNLLQVKKEIIDDVFNRVKEALKKNKSVRIELTERLLRKAISEIQIAKIYCSKEDKSIFKGYNTEFVDFLGGFIAESEDGSLRINYSFDIILETMREKELGEIAKILFGDNIR